MDALLGGNVPPGQMHHVQDIGKLLLQVNFTCRAASS